MPSSPTQYGSASQRFPSVAFYNQMHVDPGRQQPGQYESNLLFGMNDSRLVAIDLCLYSPRRERDLVDVNVESPASYTMRRRESNAVVFRPPFTIHFMHLHLHWSSYFVQL